MRQGKLKQIFEEKQFLLSITTPETFDWRAKIKEINEMGIREIALFPTCLQKRERKELYRLLEKSSIKSIPFVHLKSDMELWELDYLVNNYGTQIFNIHTHTEYPLIYDYSKYKDIIYIENTLYFFDEKELKNFGGICLDLTHLENDRLLQKEKFEHTIKMIKKYPIGANHISVIKKFIHPNERGELQYDDHYLEDLSELNYLKKYPSNYFSSFIAIELENSIKEQLRARNYIIRLLNNPY